MVIDYDKLKVAHELMKNLHGDKRYVVTMQFNGDKEPLFCFGMDLPFMYIDDLIAMLKELTQPKSKYEVGQEVWHLNDEYDPASFTVTEIDTEDDETYVSDGNYRWWSEERLHPTKLDLIQAQRKYWCKLEGIEFYTPKFEGEIEGFNTNTSEYCQVSGVKLDKKKMSCQEAIRRHHELEDDECEKCGEVDDFI